MADEFNLSGLLGDESNDQSNTNSQVPAPTKFSKYDLSGFLDDKDVGQSSGVPVEEQSSSTTIDKYGLAVAKGQAGVKDKIAERGTTWSEYDPARSITESFDWRGGLKTIGLPMELAQSAISNPIIAAQHGDINVWKAAKAAHGITNPLNFLDIARSGKELLKIAKMSFEGFTGQRQGEYGDIYRNVGVPENVSAGLGLATDLSVSIGLMNAATKIGGVSKYVDPVTQKAIASFQESVKGSHKALETVGGKVGAYWDDVANVKVDPYKFFDIIDDATTAVKRSISDIPADKIPIVQEELVNLASKGNAKAVRNAVDSIDDLINSWNKAGSGRNVSKGQKVLIQLRDKLSKFGDDAIYKAKVKQIGSGKADVWINKFHKLRGEYGSIKDNYRSIQKMMVNADTGNPTKTGKLLKEILDNRESNIRLTLKALDDVGYKYGSRANKFGKELARIEKHIRRTEAIVGISRGTAMAGAIGTVGGVTFGRVRNKLNAENAGRE